MGILSSLGVILKYTTRRGSQAGYEQVVGQGCGEVQGAKWMWWPSSTQWITYSRTHIVNRGDRPTDDGDISHIFEYETYINTCFTSYGAGLMVIIISVTAQRWLKVNRIFETHAGVSPLQPKLRITVTLQRHTRDNPFARSIPQK
jgi:hypothetical protein